MNRKKEEKRQRSDLWPLVIAIIIAIIRHI